MSLESEKSNETVVKPRFPFLFGRILAIIISAIIGPPIAGFIMGLIGVLAALISEPSKFTASLLSLPFQFALFAPFIGAPIALTLGFFGLIISIRNSVISLRSVLLITGIGILFFAIYASRKFGSFGASGNLIPSVRDIWGILIVLASYLPPALISAALCWRWLRGFHSPESPP